MDGVITIGDRVYTVVEIVGFKEGKRTVYLDKKRLEKILKESANILLGRIPIMISAKGIIYIGRKPIEVSVVGTEIKMEEEYLEYPIIEKIDWMGGIIRKRYIRYPRGIPAIPAEASDDLPLEIDEQYVIDIVPFASKFQKTLEILYKFQYP